MIKNTSKSRAKSSARENIDLFVKKKLEADNRLIDYQDNTPAHIILKTGDLIIEKTKNQKNLVVALSDFIWCKDNSDVPKSSFVPTTAEKDSKKIMEIINRLFYTSDISKLPYYSEFRHVFHLCKFYITLALLTTF